MLILQATNSDGVQGESVGDSRATLYKVGEVDRIHLTFHCHRIQSFLIRGPRARKTMTSLRDHPYSQFNFQIKFASGETLARFEQCLVGDAKQEITKISGTHKMANLTLKHGVINESSLYDWLMQAAREGPKGRRDVVLQLRKENGEIVGRWKLLQARPLKYEGPTLSGKGSDIAIEELVVAAESIELESSAKA